MSFDGAGRGTPPHRARPDPLLLNAEPALSATQHVHDQRGEESPTRSEAVRNAMCGIRRKEDHALGRQHRYWPRVRRRWSMPFMPVATRSRSVSAPFATGRLVASQAPVADPSWLHSGGRGEDPPLFKITCRSAISSPSPHRQGPERRLTGRHGPCGTYAIPTDFPPDPPTRKP